MDALVSTEWLAGELGATDLRIVDATYALAEHKIDGRAEFVAAHIPGAVFLDLKTVSDPDNPLPMMLPTSEQFTRHMSALGVGDDTRIVLYDSSPLRSSARAWWMMRHFGMTNVALLDGGLAKWRAEGRPVQAGTNTPAEHALTSARSRGDVRDLAAMRRNVDDGTEQVIDARSAARFTGAEGDPRAGVAAGHIPAAKNLHYAELFNPDGTWKTGAALQAAFDASGVDLAKPFVATCGSGVTAAVLLFGAHLLGADGALYDGSWSEWGADPTTPKATGTAA